MKTLVTLWLASLLLLVPAVQAQEAPRQWTLRDGTRGLLEADHRAPLVSICLYLPGGNRSPGLKGKPVALALEAGLFDREGALQRRLRALGGQLWAQVSADQTQLILELPSQELGAGAILWREILRNTDIHPQRLELRHAQLMRGSGAMSPASRLRQKAGELSFDQSSDPRRPSPADTVVAPLSASELLLLRARLLAIPSRILGFSGDISLPQAQLLAEEMLPVPEETGLELLLPLPNPTGARLEALTLSLDLSDRVYYCLFREGPVVWDPAFPAWLVADQVLTGGLWSRLPQALRHEAGDVYEVSSEAQAWLWPEVYAITTSTRGANAARVEQGLLEALAVFQAGGITDQERQEAVKRLRQQWSGRGQLPLTRLQGHQWELAHGLPLDGWEKVLAHAEGLALGEINAFIRTFYRREAFTLLTGK